MPHPPRSPEIPLTRSPSGACPAPLPVDERERIKTLHDYRILDTLGQQSYDDLATIAATICGTPIALVSLVDTDRQWFKARYGIDATQTPRELAFCAHAILGNALFEVPDASADRRFATNPLVTQDPNIRFYAGAPLISPAGHRIGTLCVIDRTPRELSDSQRAALEALSRQVITLLELQRVARDLEEANSLNKGILQSLNVGGILVNTDFMIEMMNPAAERMTGYQASDLVHRETPMFMHDPVDLLKVAQEINAKVGRPISPSLEMFQVMNEELGVHNREWLFQRSDGTTFPALLSTSRINDSSGELIGYFGLFEDITEQKLVQAVLHTKNERLIRTNRQLDEFAYIVSHDLRAPLRAISTLADWLSQGLVGHEDEEVHENLSLLKGRVKRMDALIQGVLEHARASRQTVQLGEVDVRALVAETVDSLQPPAGFRIEVVGELPVFTTTRVRFTQVLSNLINNAIKFNEAPSQGLVQISCSSSDDEPFYTFTVRDNGPGIEPKYHEKLFQLFQTLHARDDIESTGIGLATVRKIVEDLGGSVQVKSEKSQGAAFIFTWPKNPPNPDDLDTSRFKKRDAQ